jgi:hypothetical protein
MCTPNIPIVSGVLAPGAMPGGGGGLLGRFKAAVMTPPPAPAPSGTQPAQMADQQQARRALAALAAQGHGRGASTLLTGPGGVPNSLLNVGRNTLLGS